MTDSGSSPAGADAGRRPGKRDRLLAAACELFYEHGVERTTLAEIAGQAEVPLGNVYYYFKTKDDIIAAVVDAHIKAIEQKINSLERYSTPAARLKALIITLAREADAISRFGCPHGTLCTELSKRDQMDPEASASLLQLQLEWAEQQFTQMGLRDAKDLAIDLIAAYQGAAALTQALGRPELMARQARRLNRWIDDIPRPDPSHAAEP
jgi:AcrR family transcriptional regulator